MGERKKVQKKGRRKGGSCKRIVAFCIVFTFIVSSSIIFRETEAPWFDTRCKQTGRLVNCEQLSAWRNAGYLPPHSSLPHFSVNMHFAVPSMQHRMAQRSWLCFMTRDVSELSATCVRLSICTFVAHLTYYLSK
jgi:hypothetical protein